MGSEGESGGLVTMAIATSHLRVNAETLGLVTLRECCLADCFLEWRADARAAKPMPTDLSNCREMSVRGAVAWS